MKKISIFLLSATPLFLFVPVSAADVLAKDIVITVAPPTLLKDITFSSLLSGAIGFILIIAVLAAFIFLIWGGIQWITSGGDKTAVESARGRILAAVIGLFVVFATWAIMSMLGKFFGFDLGDLKFPTAVP